MKNKMKGMDIIMTYGERIQKAKEIFKVECKNVKEPIYLYLSDKNHNEIYITNYSGYKCTINIQTGEIKDSRKRKQS